MFTEVEIQKAIQIAKPIIDAEKSPAYLFDHFFTIWYVNQLALRVVGLDEEFIKENLGKITTFDLMFNRDYGVRQYIDSELWEDFIIQQMTRLKFFLIKNHKTADADEIFRDQLDKYPEMRMFWDRINKDLNDRVVFSRSEITLDIQGIKLNFSLFPDPLSHNERFLIMEYLPLDVGTTEYLGRIRNQGSSIEKKRINSNQISHLLRYRSDLSQLGISELLELVSVRSQATMNAVDRRVVLQKIIDDMIRLSEPVNEQMGPNRNKIRIKYEILRMMAYEGATEEQMMWDLGFESDHDIWSKNNGDKVREPRFPYRGRGDYAATSRASFKRLKAQAIEDVRWRLEELERQSNDMPLQRDNGV